MLAEEDEVDDLSSDDDSVAYEDDEKLDALVEGAALATMDKLKMLATNDDGSTALVAFNEFHYHSHQAPDDYVDPPADPATGLPEFDQVDNPGNWPSFTFFPRYFPKKTGDKRKGDYSHHSTSTGATPVPIDADGERKYGGWKFFYEGWQSEDFEHRSGSTSTDLFPEERMGKADYDLMARLGLTRSRLLAKDALFFYDLILPINDTRHPKAFENDPRLPFYSNVERWTQIYAAQIGAFSSYGHRQIIPTFLDLLHYDMIVIKDGVLGGSHGSIHKLWDVDSDLFNQTIADCMNNSRWLQVKRVYKLNDNSKQKRRGDVDFDPAQKFDEIYRVICHNVNALTKEADLDVCVNETTWANSGHGEAGTGVVSRVIGKPGVTKGGQITLVVDAQSGRVRAYTHRHKCHSKEEFPELTVEGNREIMRLVKKVEELMERSNGIFSEKPCVTADNYFSSETILDHMGRKGFGFLSTTRRDRLPRGVPGKYFHKETTSNKDKRAKVARLNNPIVAVKKEEFQHGNGDVVTYEKVHVSFQSTSSCNIASVNCLNEVNLFTSPKERGTGEHKRRWVIEMNEARQLYLKTYGVVDTIDAAVKTQKIGYVSWKYWHSAKNHGLALANVMAYSFYKEVMTREEALEYFGVSPEEAKESFMTFSEFLQTMSTQGLQYHPMQR